MHKSLVIALICLLAPIINGEERQTTAIARSPDGHWEYRYTDDIEGVIVKAGTTEIVLDVADNIPRPQHATVLWAPDSKRFAFTASPPHVSHTSFDTTTVYQLRGNKWEPADPIANEESHVPQVTQLMKGRLPQSKDLQRMYKSSPIRDIVRAVKWIDGDSLVIRAHAEWDRKRKPDYAAFLLTLKFDAEGKWKIVKTEDVTNRKEDEE